MFKKINRRIFFTNAAISAGGIFFENRFTGSSSGTESGKSSFAIMKEIMKYRKINTNAHINPLNGDTASLKRNVDLLGIERMAISVPNETGSLPPTLFQEGNDKVIRDGRMFPVRLSGKITWSRLCVTGLCIIDQGIFFGFFQYYKLHNRIKKNYNSI